MDLSITRSMSASPSLLAFSPAAPHQPSAWDTAIEGVLEHDDRISMALQPIVDLTRGVVTGFESLARFRGEVSASPDVWFKEAERRGCAVELEVRTARRALQAARELPPNCFLTLNVSPALLVSPAWAALVAEVGRLDAIVVEVTEHAAIEDYVTVRTCIQDIRACGGAFAVDDAGSGFASLNHVLALRPDFVKLDRVFVAGCDSDAAKRALIEMMGAFAGRLDAWIIAEGIETLDELRTLSVLRVPLAQGYLLGKPQPTWSGVAQDAAAQLSAWRDDRRRATSIRPVTEHPTVAASVEQARAAISGGASGVVVVDTLQRPVAMVDETGQSGSPMRVKASSDAAEVLKRALTRERGLRFAPLVVIDEQGRTHGLVRLERLIELVALSQHKA